MAEGIIPEDFEVGEPVLVCRWRLSNRALPASNRHMRALAKRSVDGAPLSSNLMAWVRQHIEWTLKEGTVEHPDGVLMLVVDALGRAAMSAGDYVPLADDSRASLIERARASRLEALETDVAPEALWAMEADGLVCGIAIGEQPSGANSLIIDLAQTMGMSVVRDAALVERVADDPACASEVFLVSDEHGVIVASDASGLRGTRFRDGWQRLLDSADRPGGHHKRAS